MSDLSGEYAFDTLLERFEISAVMIAQKNTEIQQLRDQVRELQELSEQIKTASELEKLQEQQKSVEKLEEICTNMGDDFSAYAILNRESCRQIDTVATNNIFTSPTTVVATMVDSN